MRKTTSLFLLSLALWAMTAACTRQAEYAYTTVPGDPMHSRIYTLKNGLKVYMTENDETPRIQTYIAVRVGSKNDPAETTGLAHYFEHLMFKGTKQFGTQNYEQERPLLDSIEARFETYRSTTDPVQRAAIYRAIDSLSYEASKLAIPNEYDKLMTAIGATGTNAYTGYDQTVYIENIPANETENWAKIQTDRFSDAVIRGFHTELETVYEEKNMSLTRDNQKMVTALLSALFPNHPYGTQTVLGTQEHLKNPSITNIKNYYKKYYVPNNMAICLSGDFDPDEMIRVIDRYFGSLRPNDSLPAYRPAEVPVPEKTVVREVWGQETPSLLMGWRIAGNTLHDRELTALLSAVLYNGQAGLIDLNVNQRQKVLGAYAGTLGLTDYEALLAGATPKAGQTLEEAQAVVLEEIEKVKRGEFDEQLLQATLNNYKRSQMALLESNESRADLFVSSFINGTDWAEEVKTLDRLSRITKEEIVRFANENLKDNYVTIFKRQGTDPDEQKIAKPEITPIETNRDTSSAFLRAIQLSRPAPIAPHFVDFATEMQTGETRGKLPVLYKRNETNGLFTLTYLFDLGSQNDKTLGLAAGYLDYLGTGDMTPEQIRQEFYRLACTFSVSPGVEQTYVTLSGLDENMEAAMKLFEKLLAEARPDAAALANLKSDLLKSRADAKLNQQANFNALQQYAIYGPRSPLTNILNAEELAAVTPEELTQRLQDLFGYEHRILYYGPRSLKEITETVDREHKTPAQFKAVPAGDPFKQQLTPENKVLIAPYQAKQIYLRGISNRGETFDPSITPVLTLYNEYFGGGMNSIVFQEMREARGLAYSAGAGLQSPSKLGNNYLMTLVIATQNDKMADALAAFDEIINDMPESEQAFALAKEGLLTRLRTSRINKANVLWYYLSLQKLGLDTDPQEQTFREVQRLTLDDIEAFQEKWVKGRTYVYCILGDEAELDMKALEKYGPVERLTTEQIFGY